MKGAKLTVAVGAVVLLVGCGPDETAAIPEPKPIPGASSGAPTATDSGVTVAFRPDADAGVPLDTEAIVALPTVQQIAENSTYATRTNPFALLPEEQAFDRDQHIERILAEMGGFSLYWEPPEPIMEPEVSAPTEPLPLWRLSGIVIGDGILAILDMGDSSIEIRPGMRIPDTPWVVVSIDTEKAVLRRIDDGQPREFTVWLEGPMNPGGGGGGNSGGGGGPGGGDDDSGGFQRRGGGATGMGGLDN